MSVLIILILEAVGLQIRPSRLKIVLNGDVFRCLPKRKMVFSKIFRPISDLSLSCLKRPGTKGFVAFGAKFSDLKRVGRFPAIFLQNAPIFCIFVVSSIKRAKHSQPTGRSSDATP